MGWRFAGRTDFRQLSIKRVFNEGGERGIRVPDALKAETVKNIRKRAQRGNDMANRRNLSVAALVVMLLAAVSAQATSHVRIVRLSYEDGSVQMDRTGGQGLERAILNSPIVEGTRIVTGTDGLAEVEFENNSTVRLGEATDVKFRQLLINDAGELVNEVELVRGTMYFDTESGKNNIYRVIAAGSAFVVQRNSQARFMMSGDQVQVAVLNGEIRLRDNAEGVKIKKKDTLTVDATNPAGFILAKGIDSNPLDRWNNERAAYQSAYAYNNTGYGAFGGPKLAGYGFQDLAYYGGFMMVPGYGMVWQPYGASSWMGWNPYVAGAWAYAPGVGYSWASAYAWGWLPYHYGSWAYSSGIGWFWVPGNSFQHGGTITNWQATTPVIKGPPGYTAPTAPPAPVMGHRPPIMVGRIGQAPAYIPGGPVPPNFRSVIDRSSMVGMTSPMTGGTRYGNSAAPARGSRAIRTSGSDAAPANARTFAAPGTATSGAGVERENVARSHNQSGHVFAAPAPAWSSPGFSSPAAPSVGRSIGPVQGAGAPMQRSPAPIHSSGGMGRAASSGGAAHGAASANPK